MSPCEVITEKNFPKQFYDCVPSSIRNYRVDGVKKQNYDPQ